MSVPKAVRDVKVGPRGDVRAWLAIVDADLLHRITREKWHVLPLATDVPRPGKGDRIDVLVTHGPRFFQEARFAGSAAVVRDDGVTLRIRHSFIAREGHQPTLAEVGLLHIATGWTDERLADLMSGLIQIGTADHERIERALRVVALEFGPAPSRPAHRRPRTPGRRALIAGRAAWRRP